MKPHANFIPITSTENDPQSNRRGENEVQHARGRPLSSASETNIYNLSRAERMARMSLSFGKISKRNDSLPELTWMPPVPELQAIYEAIVRDKKSPFSNLVSVMKAYSQRHHASFCNTLPFSCLHHPLLTSVHWWNVDVLCFFLAMGLESHWRGNVLPHTLDYLRKDAGEGANTTALELTQLMLNLFPNASNASSRHEWKVVAMKASIALLSLESADIQRMIGLRHLRWLYLNRNKHWTQLGMNSSHIDMTIPEVALHLHSSAIQNIQSQLQTASIKAMERFDVPVISLPSVDVDGVSYWSELGLLHESQYAFCLRSSASQSTFETIPPSVLRNSATPSVTNGGPNYHSQSNKQALHQVGDSPPRNVPSLQNTSLRSFPQGLEVHTYGGSGHQNASHDSADIEMRQHGSDSESDKERIRRNSTGNQSSVAVYSGFNTVPEPIGNHRIAHSNDDVRTDEETNGHGDPLTSRQSNTRHKDGLFVDQSLLARSPAGSRKRHRGDPSTDRPAEGSGNFKNKLTIAATIDDTNSLEERFDNAVILFAQGDVYRYSDLIANDLIIEKLVSCPTKIHLGLPAIMEHWHQKKHLPKFLNLPVHHKFHPLLQAIRHANIDSLCFFLCTGMPAWKEGTVDLEPRGHRVDMLDVIERKSLRAVTTVLEFYRDCLLQFIAKDVYMGGDGEVLQASFQPESIAQWFFLFVTSLSYLLDVDRFQSRQRALEHLQWRKTIGMKASQTGRVSPPRITNWRAGITSYTLRKLSHWWHFINQSPFFPLPESDAMGTSYWSRGSALWVPASEDKREVGKKRTSEAASSRLRRLRRFQPADLSPISTTSPQIYDSSALFSSATKPIRPSSKKSTRDTLRNQEESDCEQSSSSNSSLHSSDEENFVLHPNVISNMTSSPKRKSYRKPNNSSGKLTPGLQEQEEKLPKSINKQRVSHLAAPRHSETVRQNTSRPDETLDSSSAVDVPLPTETFYDGPMLSSHDYYAQELAKCAGGRESYKPKEVSDDLQSLICSDIGIFSAKCVAANKDDLNRVLRLWYDVVHGTDLSSIEDVTPVYIRSMKEAREYVQIMDFDQELLKRALSRFKPPFAKEDSQDHPLLHAVHRQRPGLVYYFLACGIDDEVIGTVHPYSGDYCTWEELYAVTPLEAASMLLMKSNITGSRNEAKIAQEVHNILVEHAAAKKRSAAEFESPTPVVGLPKDMAISIGTNAGDSYNKAMVHRNTDENSQGAVIREDASEGIDNGTLSGLSSPNSTSVDVGLLEAPEESPSSRQFEERSGLSSLSSLDSGFSTSNTNVQVRADSTNVHPQLPPHSADWKSNKVNGLDITDPSSRETESSRGMRDPNPSQLEHFALLFPKRSARKAAIQASLQIQSITKGLLETIRNKRNDLVPTKAQISPQRKDIPTIQTREPLPTKLNEKKQSNAPRSTTSAPKRRHDPADLYDSSSTSVTSREQGPVLAHSSQAKGHKMSSTVPGYTARVTNADKDNSSGMNGEMDIQSSSNDASSSTPYSPMLLPLPPIHSDSAPPNMLPEDGNAVWSLDEEEKMVVEAGVSSYCTSIYPDINASDVSSAPTASSLVATHSNSLEDNLSLEFDIEQGTQSTTTGTIVSQQNDQRRISQPSLPNQNRDTLRESRFQAVSGIYPDMEGNNEALVCVKKRPQGRKSADIEVPKRPGTRNINLVEGKSGQYGDSDESEDARGSPTSMDPYLRELVRMEKKALRDERKRLYRVRKSTTPRDDSSFGGNAPLTFYEFHQEGDGSNESGRIRQTASNTRARDDADDIRLLSDSLRDFNSEPFDDYWDDQLDDFSAESSESDSQGASIQTDLASIEQGVRRNASTRQPHRNLGNLRDNDVIVSKSARNKRTMSGNRRSSFPAMTPHSPKSRRQNVRDSTIRNTTRMPRFTKSKSRRLVDSRMTTFRSHAKDQNPQVMGDDSEMSEEDKSWDVQFLQRVEATQESESDSDSIVFDWGIETAQRQKDNTTFPVSRMVFHASIGTNSSRNTAPRTNIIRGVRSLNSGNSEKNAQESLSGKDDISNSQRLDMFALEEYVTSLQERAKAQKRLERKRKFISSHTTTTSSGRATLNDGEPIVPQPRIGGAAALPNAQFRVDPMNPSLSSDIRRNRALLLKDQFLHPIAESVRRRLYAVPSTLKRVFDSHAGSGTGAPVTRPLSNSEGGSRREDNAAYRSDGEAIVPGRSMNVSSSSRKALLEKKKKGLELLRTKGTIPMHSLLFTDPMSMLNFNASIYDEHGYRREKTRSTTEIARNGFLSNPTDPIIGVQTIGHYLPDGIKMLPSSHALANASKASNTNLVVTNLNRNATSVVKPPTYFFGSKQVQFHNIATLEGYGDICRTGRLLDTALRAMRKMWSLSKLLDTKSRRYIQSRLSGPSHELINTTLTHTIAPLQTLRGMNEEDQHSATIHQEFPPTTTNDVPQLAEDDFIDLTADDTPGHSNPHSVRMFANETSIPQEVLAPVSNHRVSKMRAAILNCFLNTDTRDKPSDMPQPAQRAHTTVASDLHVTTSEPQVPMSVETRSGENALDNGPDVTQDDASWSDHGTEALDNVENMIIAAQSLNWMGQDGRKSASSLTGNPLILGDEDDEEFFIHRDPSSNNTIDGNLHASDSAPGVDSQLVTCTQVALAHRKQRLQERLRLQRLYTIQFPLHASLIAYFPRKRPMPWWFGSRIRLSPCRATQNGVLASNENASGLTSERHLEMMMRNRLRLMSPFHCTLDPNGILENAHASYELLNRLSTNLEDAPYPQKGMIAVSIMSVLVTLAMAEIADMECIRDPFPSSLRKSDDFVSYIASGNNRVSVSSPSNSSTAEQANNSNAHVEITNFYSPPPALFLLALTLFSLDTFVKQSIRAIATQLPPSVAENSINLEASNAIRPGSEQASVANAEMIKQRDIEKSVRRFLWSVIRKFCHVNSHEAAHSRDKLSQRGTHEQDPHVSPKVAPKKAADNELMEILFTPLANSSTDSKEMGNEKQLAQEDLVRELEEEDNEDIDEDTAGFCMSPLYLFEFVVRPKAIVPGHVLQTTLFGVVKSLLTTASEVDPTSSSHFKSIDPSTSFIVQSWSMFATTVLQWCRLLEIVQITHANSPFTFQKEITILRAGIGSQLLQLMSDFPTCLDLPLSNIQQQLLLKPRQGPDDMSDNLQTSSQTLQGNDLPTNSEYLINSPIYSVLLTWIRTFPSPLHGWNGLVSLLDANLFALQRDLNSKKRSLTVSVVSQGILPSVFFSSLPVHDEFQQQLESTDTTDNSPLDGRTRVGNMPHGVTSVEIDEVPSTILDESYTTTHPCIQNEARRHFLCTLSMKVRQIVDIFDSSEDSLTPTVKGNLDQILKQQLATYGTADAYIELCSTQQSKDDEDALHNIATHVPNEAMSHTHHLHARDISSISSVSREAKLFSAVCSSRSTCEIVGLFHAPASVADSVLFNTSSEMRQKNLDAEIEWERINVLSTMLRRQIEGNIVCGRVMETDDINFVLPISNSTCLDNAPTCSIHYRNQHMGRAQEGDRYERMEVISDELRIFNSLCAQSEMRYALQHWSMYLSPPPLLRHQIGTNISATSNIEDSKVIRECLVPMIDLLVQIVHRTVRVHRPSQSIVSNVHPEATALETLSRLIGASRLSNFATNHVMAHPLPFLLPRHKSKYGPFPFAQEQLGQDTTHEEAPEYPKLLSENLNNAAWINRLRPGNNTPNDKHKYRYTSELFTLPAWLYEQIADKSPPVVWKDPRVTPSTSHPNEIRDNDSENVNSGITNEDETDTSATISFLKWLNHPYKPSDLGNQRASTEYEPSLVGDSLLTFSQLMDADLRGPYVTLKGCQTIHALFHGMMLLCYAYGAPATSVVRHLTRPLVMFSVPVLQGRDPIVLMSSDMNTLWENKSPHALSRSSVEMAAFCAPKYVDCEVLPTVESHVYLQTMIIANLIRVLVAPKSHLTQEMTGLISHSSRFQRIISPRYSDTLALILWLQGNYALWTLLRNSLPTQSLRITNALMPSLNLIASVCCEQIGVLELVGLHKTGLSIMPNNAQNQRKPLHGSTTSQLQQQSNAANTQFQSSEVRKSNYLSYAHSINKSSDADTSLSHEASHLHSVLCAWFPFHSNCPHKEHSTIRIEHNTPIPLAMFLRKTAHMENAYLSQSFKEFSTSKRLVQITSEFWLLLRQYALAIGQSLAVMTVSSIEPFLLPPPLWVTKHFLRTCPNSDETERVANTITFERYMETEDKHMASHLVPVSPSVESVSREKYLTQKMEVLQTSSAELRAMWSWIWLNKEPDASIGPPQSFPTNYSKQYCTQCRPLQASSNFSLPILTNLAVRFTSTASTGTLPCFHMAVSKGKSFILDPHVVAFSCLDVLLTLSQKPFTILDTILTREWSYLQFLSDLPSVETVLENNASVLKQVETRESRVKDDRMEVVDSLPNTVVDQLHSQIQVGPNVDDEGLDSQFDGIPALDVNLDMLDLLENDELFIEMEKMSSVNILSSLFAAFLAVHRQLCYSLVCISEIALTHLPLAQCLNKFPMLGQPLHPIETFGTNPVLFLFSPAKKGTSNSTSLTGTVAGTVECKCATDLAKNARGHLNTPSHPNPDVNAPHVLRFLEIIALSILRTSGLESHSTRSRYRNSITLIRSEEVWKSDQEQTLYSNAIQPFNTVRHSSCSSPSPSIEFDLFQHDLDTESCAGCCNQFTCLHESLSIETVRTVFLKTTHALSRHISLLVTIPRGTSPFIRMHSHFGSENSFSTPVFALRDFSARYFTSISEPSSGISDSSIVLHKSDISPNQVDLSTLSIWERHFTSSIFPRVINRHIIPLLTMSVFSRWMSDATFFSGYEAFPPTNVPNLEMENNYGMTILCIDNAANSGTFSKVWRILIPEINHVPCLKRQHALLSQQLIQLRVFKDGIFYAQLLGMSVLAAMNVLAPQNQPFAKRQITTRTLQYLDWVYMYHVRKWPPLANWEAHLDLFRIVYALFHFARSICDENRVMLLPYEIGCRDVNKYDQIRDTLLNQDLPIASMPKNTNTLITPFAHDFHFLRKALLWALQNAETVHNTLTNIGGEFFKAKTREVFSRLK